MRQKAFTLVELSIVLVVIGLLVGGIIAGDSLIHSSRVRGVIADRDKYALAISAFKEKYRAMPGDMANATQFWGAQDGGDGLGADCTGVAITSAATCNGNGDGFVANMHNGAWTSEAHEAYRAWQHMANAGLVSVGPLTGTLSPLPAQQYAIPGYNIPETKIKGLGFHLQANASSGFIGWAYPAGIEGHYLELGGNNQIDGHYYNGKPILRAQDAHYIDSKVDDGKPPSGSIIAMPSGCQIGVAPNITYDLLTTTAKCTLFILLDL